MKASGSAIKLLKELIQAGYRIFSIAQAREMAIELGLKGSYVKEILSTLKRDGWIQPVKRGVYSVTEESGFGSPHEYEIATSLVSPSAISHWSALYHHHLTQQIPRTIFVLTPSGTVVPRSLLPSEYQFVRIKSEYYFGVTWAWIGDAKVSITDPERTLLDGLMMPQYCGGFEEVLHGFRMRGDQLDIQKIVEYALQLTTSTIKRLGWILEYLAITDDHLDLLLHKEVKGIRKLNPLGPDKGPINRRWMIRENLGVSQ